MYLDGALVGDDVAGTFGLATAFNLGGNGVNLQFQGGLSNLAIYNYQLSSAQGVTHYQSGLAQIEKVTPAFRARERASYSAAVASDGPACYWRPRDAGASG